MIGSLGYGISVVAAPRPSDLARRYHLHTLVAAAILRPFLVLWSAIRAA